MILIADSGSTKCDWVVINETGEVVFKTKTKGLNPNVLTTQKMHKRVAESEELAHVNNNIKKIYFYGAGCGTAKNRVRIKRFLEKYFRNAICKVKEDLWAACISVTDKPGIVSILGTGSNSCYFDGSAVKTKIPSMGYGLMDEGSGNYFGKQLLLDYYYGKMPESVAKDFEKEYDVSPTTVKTNLYRKQNPNAYLAGFAPFMFKEWNADKEKEYFQNLIKEGIALFIERWVMVYEEERLQTPVHFVGSIAYHLQDIIKTSLEERGLQMGNVICKPIDGLLSYFVGKMKQESLV